MREHSNKKLYFLIYIFIAAIVFLSINHSVSSYEAEIEDISSREYFPKVIEVINSSAGVGY